MPVIKFLKEKKEIEVPEGANLREEAIKNGIQVYKGATKYWPLNCAGHGVCTTCRVRVRDGQQNLSARRVWERIGWVLHPLGVFGFLDRIGNEDEARLSCQTSVNGDCEVETRPEFNWHGEEKFWS